MLNYARVGDIVVTAIDRLRRSVGRSHAYDR
jgi:hypothetical protein